MKEAEFHGGKKEAFSFQGIAGVSVFLIADNGVAEGGHMNAQLVGSSGDR